LLIRPRSFIEPLPLLANTKVEVSIETPIALGLFANLKPRIRTPLRTQLTGCSHFKISGDERL